MRTALTLAVAMLAAGAAIAGQTPVQPAPPGTGPKLLYPASDPEKDIAAALASAAKDGRYVLVDFGADWCPDCRVLGALFDNPIVAPFAAANFHIVHVDVGRRDKNAEVVAKYHATSDAWIPAVVVLDAEGTTIAVTDDHVRLTRRDTPQQLLEVLQQWAPKKKWFDLAAFTEDGVHVSLTLERGSDGRVWLAGRFVPTQAGVHLYSKDLPIGGLDGLGRPTRLSVTPAGGLTVLGATVADRPVEADRIEALNASWPIYPAGPVTLRLPVALERSGPRLAAEVSVTYMGCGPKGCLRPVVDKRVVLSVPPQA